MSYKLDVIQDNPVAFWLLDELSGSIAYDSSPYGNEAEYFGNINSSHLPIVTDSKNSKSITDLSRIEYSYGKDFIGNDNTTSFGTKETADNDFTLECWVKINVLDDSIAFPILGDSQSDIGIFWQSGNIIVKAPLNLIRYAVPNYNRALHIVCVYTSNSISLYVNGELVKQSTFSNFNYTNESLYLKTGPTSNSDNSILIDCVAIYRYSLSSIQIKNHYFSAQSIPSIQIVAPDNGQLFQISDNGISREFDFSYPANKSWSYFNSNELVYNSYEKSLSLAEYSQGPGKVVEILDVVSVPLGFDLNSSKIEWLATKGIEVYASIDNVNFLRCQNGSSIPKYKFGSNNFNDSRIIYLSIKFNSLDTTKYLPKIYNLMVSFYNNKKIYSFNGGSSMGHFNNELLSSDISFGNYYTPILFRDEQNGLTCRDNSGFSIKTKLNVNTVEFFYTPKYLKQLIDAEVTDIVSSSISIIDSTILSNLDQAMTPSELNDVIFDTKGNLIFNESAGVEYSWLPDGSIISSGITSIYVNGIDVSNEANIYNILSPNKLVYIVMTLDSPVTEEIMFNYSVRGAVVGTYQNIAIYESKFSEAKINQHLDLWTGRYKAVADDSSFSMTENSILTYDNDWVVIQTV